MKRAIHGLIILVSILFVSCLGVQLETSFNPDGSGVITMRIRVSQTLLEMGDETDVPIPISQEEIEAAYADVEGLTLIDAYEEETEEDRVLVAAIAFDDFEAVSEQEDFAGVTLSQEGDLTVYRVVVGEETEEGDDEAMSEGDGETSDEDAEMAEAMEAMIMAFMEGYFIEYRVVAPSEVVSFSHGELFEDGRTVELRIPMADYMNLEPYVFEVTW